jgi:hypothetical protein
LTVILLSFQGGYETSVKTVRDTVSPKIDAVSRSCIRLKNLLEGVKICRKQCNYLVQACVDGIQKMTKLYSLVDVDNYQMWRLYSAGLLTPLCNSLDRLEFALCDAQDLLKACAKEVGRIALVVSMPPKNMEVCSMFDLLVGELMWNLDLIEHLLQPEGSTQLEWSPTERRYALKRSHGCFNVIAEERSTETRPEDVRSLARIDRKDLQSGLEDGSIFIPDTSRIFGWFAQLCFDSEKNVLHNIIFKRCKVEMHLDQNPSMGSRSPPMDLECFELHHLDLKLGSLLGAGTFKDTYEGEWCGQKVAIATMRDFELQDLQGEVKQLLWLQHPKVVSFFGWAYTDDAPAPIRKPADDEECRGGYIVTEKMECDLESLIETTRKEVTNQSNSGGPFSHSVGLDIVLQIVEAMLHVQKHSVMHRDLKPGNFLVNTRSSPKSGTDKYYDVKLIDFGSSKLLGEDKNTYNMGTSRYGAPEMQVGGDHGPGEKGIYGPSVDVFSFAMTCYQVITGGEPFRKLSTRQARVKIRDGGRPDFPATILSGWKELIEVCWQQKPKSRPTFEKIQERLWTIKKDLAARPL